MEIRPTAVRVSPPPLPRREEGEVSTESLPNDRSIPGYKALDIPKGEGGFQRLLAEMAARGKSTRRVWSEAAQLGLIGAGPIVGAPIGATLSREAGESISKLLDELAERGVRLRSDGRIADADTAWRLRTGQPQRVTAEGPDFAAQPVESLEDLRALDALYVGGDLRHARHPGVLGALRETREAGWDFIDLAGTHLSSYGAYIYFRHNWAGLRACSAGQVQGVRSMRVAEALPFFLLGKPVERLPNAPLAEEMRALAADGWNFERGSAAEAWEMMTLEPGMSMSVTRGARTCDVREFLSETVKDGLRRRAALLESGVRASKDDRAVLLDLGVDGRPGLAPADALAAAQRLGVDDFEFVLATPAIGRTVAESVALFGDLRTQMPSRDARKMFTRAASCAPLKSDPYLAAGRRLGDAESLHAAWFWMHDKADQTEILLTLADRQGVLDAATRGRNAYDLYQMTSRAPLAGCDAARSASLAQDLADCVQPQHGVEQVKTLYRLLSGKEEPAQRVGAFVEAWARTANLEKALAACERLDLKVQQEESFVVIGGVRVPRRV